MNKKKLHVGFWIHLTLTAIALFFSVTNDNLELEVSGVIIYCTMLIIAHAYLVGTFVVSAIKEWGKDEPN